MSLFGSIFRARRGDLNLFLIAALVALLVVPCASHAALPPQSYEAVLFWLQSETAAPTPVPVANLHALLSISHQKAEIAAPVHAQNHFSVATSHCGQFLTCFPSKAETKTQIAPAMLVLERHAVARLSGVRTNRRLI